MYIFGIHLQCIKRGTGRRTVAAALLCGLLGACSTPAQLAGDAATATDAAPRPMRMRSQDILSEWGTFGIERPALRKRGSTAARLRDGQTYSPSIREIIASAACRACESKPYHEMVMQASSQHGVPPALIHAVIQKESGYNPVATSPRQARGLMQLTPDTGRMLGVHSTAALYDPRTNINAGTAYLSLLMQSHDTVEEVLAAYNAGPGNVRRYNGVPPFAETRRYVQDVKRAFTYASSD